MVAFLFTSPNKQMQLHFVPGFAKCPLCTSGSAFMSDSASLRRHSGDIMGGHFCICQPLVCNRPCPYARAGGRHGNIIRRGRMKWPLLSIRTRAPSILRIHGDPGTNTRPSRGGGIHRGMLGSAGLAPPRRRGRHCGPACGPGLSGIQHAATRFHLGRKGPFHPNQGGGQQQAFIWHVSFIKLSHYE